VNPAPDPERQTRTGVAPQLVRFAVVGGANSAITLGSYAGLLALGLHYVVAGAIGFALGALNGYTLNRTWTFQAGAFDRGGLARYAVVQAAGVALNAGVLAVLVEVAGTPHLAAQVVSLPVVSASTFLASRNWVFAAAR
jgi:putative flippase GtrA